MGWKFVLDEKAWLGQRDLYVRHETPLGAVSFVAPLILQAIREGETYDVATISETRESVRDGAGAVTGFLQAALDAAWEVGLRPRGFGDHTNELTAVREHLADMRLLALPQRTS